MTRTVRVASRRIVSNSVSCRHSHSHSLPGGVNSITFEQLLYVHPRTSVYAPCSDPHPALTRNCKVPLHPSQHSTPAPAKALG